MKLRDAWCLVLLACVLTAPAAACPTIAACELALQRAPRDAGVRRDYGQMLLRAGAYDEALESYRQAVALAPEDARSHEALGAALAFLRDYAGAMPELEQAVALDPGAVQSLRMLQIVQDGLRLREAAIGTARKLADRGDVLAMYDLAVALEQSEPEQAAMWLKRAAEAGHVAAMDQLAQAHFDGALGPASNAAEGETWATRAREARGR